MLNVKGEQIGQVSSDDHRGTRWRVLVIMAPTEPENPCLPRAASGKWTVVIRRSARAAIDHPIHCWIQRSTDPEILRSGSRQSYFDDLKDHRYTVRGDLNEKDSNRALVRRFGSLNGLATERRSLDVAGYRLGAGLGSTLKEARPSRYSSAGVLKEPWPQAQIACSSMSDRSRVVAGTIAAGVRSGSRSLVQGTSAAAPFVARKLATAFITADEETVGQAATDNYLALLLPLGYVDNSSDEEIKARLGTVRVPPHWQPGVDVDDLLRKTPADADRGSNRTAPVRPRATTARARRR